jgi:hypothetical protein
VCSARPRSAQHALRIKLSRVHPFVLLLARFVIVFAAIVTSDATFAEDRTVAAERLPRAAFNPVTFLRQAIAVVLPAHSDAAVVADDAEAGLAVAFASGAHERVSLSLAESRLRVRLGEELQLHCEVSSYELDAEPELGIDLAIRFKFE